MGPDSVQMPTSQASVTVSGELWDRRDHLIESVVVQVKVQRSKARKVPTVAVSLVCRGAEMSELVTVKRTLAGTPRVMQPRQKLAEFEAFHLRPDDEQCVQVRDIIMPGMSEGNFRYRVRLITKQGEIASAERVFDAVDGTGS